jgi:spore coat polysaccharide biosynthesis predicted glycosyltransferase SpsG
MVHVRIICDGGGEFGFGNLRRSATLAAVFRSCGHDARIDVVSEEARRLLPEAAPAQEGEPDIWLLDLPYAGDSWVAAARARSRPVVALDYVGALAPDLVISIFNRGTAPAKTRHLVGFDYAIIDPDIAALAPAPPGRGVIVVIGGGDRSGLAEDAAVRLQAQGCDVTLIDGPLAVTTRILPAAIMRVSRPADLPARMAGSAWGVTSGGGAMMEMFCLGKAVHALPRTDAENALVRLAMERQAVLGIGLESLRVPSKTKLEEVSVAARRLVDGQGAERIVRASQSLL